MLVLILNKSLFPRFFHLNSGKSDMVLENAICCECFTAHELLIELPRMCDECRFYLVQSAKSLIVE